VNYVYCAPSLHHSTVGRVFTIYDFMPSYVGCTGT